MRTCLGIIGVLLLCLMGVVGYFWLFRWSTETEVATRMGSEFLARHSLDLKAFEGPEIRAPANAEKTFTWKPRDKHLKLQLDVSPGGDMVCLYKVLDETHVKDIACDLPK